MGIYEERNFDTAFVFRNAYWWEPDLGVNVLLSYARQEQVFLEVRAP